VFVLSGVGRCSLVCVDHSLDFRPGPAGHGDDCTGRSPGGLPRARWRRYRHWEGTGRRHAASLRVQLCAVRQEAAVATRTPPPTGGAQHSEASALLASGRWEDAVLVLEAEVDAAGTAPGAELAGALTGLSEARWWLGRLEEALTARARAYEVWRRIGGDGQAACAAAWLAVEHGAVSGRGPVAEGWLARARTLAEGSEDAGAGGWVALAEAVLAADAVSQSAAAEEALLPARAAGDGDLEVLALGRLGLAEVAAGRVERGLRRLDEAMASAVGGDAGRSALARLCCDLVRAAELSGEMERFARWQQTIVLLAGDHGHPSLVASCATCCAEAFVAVGDWAGAERELRSALGALQQSGAAVRCVAPTAKLGDLLVAQGRLEEAERLLEGEDSDDALLPRARLALAQGQASTAVALAQRHVRRLGGESLATTASMLVLVDAHLAAGDGVSAQTLADRLRALGTDSGHRRTLARAALAQARVAADDHVRMRMCLEEALDHLAAVAPGAIETAEAHLELARLHVVEAPALAISEARAALVGFETAGAAHGADAAAALLRRLGDRSNVGPKNVGMLTRREQEVLRLVAAGLTNREIAERLFISPKTASNHVSNILTKLGARTRTEAAALAASRLQAPSLG
jgi:DNA-binding CsgD family transcriptional regulator